VTMHSEQDEINKTNWQARGVMRYSEQRLPDGQRVRYGDTSGIQSMQYGLSNHLTAPEPCKRGLAETVAIKKRKQKKELEKMSLSRKKPQRKNQRDEVIKRRRTKVGVLSRECVFSHRTVLPRQK
jgi:hypothetical protein